MANFETVSPEMAALNKIMGGFLFIVGCMLFTVRWNPINGKLSGIACIACGMNIAHTTLNSLDNGVFFPRLFYAYAAVLGLVGLHIMFCPNPAIVAAARRVTVSVLRTLYVLLACFVIGLDSFSNQPNFAILVRMNGFLVYVCVHSN